MSKIFVKAEGKLWPTVLWQKTQLVVYFMGDETDDVEVRETRGIDFDEVLLHIDRGGSVFITTKPVDQVKTHRVRSLDEFVVAVGDK